MATPLHLKRAQGVLTLKEINEAGRIEGYASAFHVVDSDDDVIQPGAFRKSLEARNGAPLPMLWQHRSDEPIGAWTEYREDDRGLFVAGHLLVDDVAKAREARALAKAGALGGMSIGFMLVRAEPRRDSDRGGLDIYEADVWENSLVTFPANPGAQISAVKSALDAGELPTIRDFERLLTRDAGFSRSQAQAVIRDGYAALLATRDAGDDDWIEALQGLTTTIQEASQ